MRIVIVDDEYQTRLGLVRLMGRLDPSYTVVGEAEDGYEGMRLIRSLQPDVVITDIKMPRVDGLDMIENARGASPDTHFLILSGYAEFELARRAVNLPVVAYLLKPVTAEEIGAALRMLQKGAPAAEADAGANTVAEGAHYHDITKHIVQTIEQQYAQKLQLEELARHLNVTPEYAGRIFSKDTGKSFSIYLRDVRMENAKRLLEGARLKIYEVAYKTGFSDVKYFCRTFKAYTGVSAGRYVRRHLINN